MYLVKNSKCFDTVQGKNILLHWTFWSPTQLELNNIKASAAGLPDSSTPDIELHQMWKTFLDYVNVKVSRQAIQSFYVKPEMLGRIYEGSAGGAANAT